MFGARGHLVVPGVANRFDPNGACLYQFVVGRMEIRDLWFQIKICLKVRGGVLLQRGDKVLRWDPYKFFFFFFAVNVILRFI
ncbi:hypothetical protein ACOSQ4_021192 [Xanthoceras sorbifolium]